MYGGRYNRSDTLTVKDLDLHLRENKREHHTGKYQMRQPKLVLRRGQEFKLTLIFDRSYNKAKDELVVVFSPVVSSTGRGDRTLVETIPVEVEREEPFPPHHRGWGARVLQSRGPQMEVCLHVAGDALVGEWSMQVRDAGSGGAAGEGGLQESVIILFNPWSPGDQVYFPDDPRLLLEYVLKDTGLVFRGMASSVSSSHWTYGQFKPGILDTCLTLLRKAFNDDISHDMKDAVMVSRALSRIVNSQDDRGVLEGRWDGNYGGWGNVKPTRWKSSIPILRRYARSGRPVRYGQCWVFSHVLTTVCRALGLPCRSVTNFDSAHDTDMTCTIDYYFSESGEKLEPLSRDSIWNFHVWNEVWLLRPDLGEAGGRYSGWHVIDATPQEQSGGLMQCGPCPVKAVKEGEVGVGLDTKFVFSEVNAELVHWTRTPDGQFDLSNVDHSRVGAKVTTKQPLVSRPMDITLDYKYPEGSEKERMAVSKAVGEGRVGRVLYKDLEVSFEAAGETMVGRTLQMRVLVRNVAGEGRVVEASITAQATAYFDYTHSVKTLAHRSFQRISLPAGKTVPLSLEVLFSEYQEVCDESWAIQGVVNVKDLQTQRHYTAEQRFAPRAPPLLVSGPAAARSGQPVTVTLVIANPLPLPLSECRLHLDGTLEVSGDDPHAWSNEDGTLSMDFRRGSGLKPSERATLTVRLVGQWREEDLEEGQPEPQSMTFTFNCAELDVMEGAYELTPLL